VFCFEEVVAINVVVGFGIKRFKKFKKYNKLYKNMVVSFISL